MSMDYQNQIWQELSSPWRSQLGMSGQSAPSWATPGGHAFNVSPSGFTMGDDVGGAVGGQLVGSALSGQLFNKPLTTLKDTGIRAAGTAIGSMIGGPAGATAGNVGVEGIKNVLSSFTGK